MNYLQRLTALGVQRSPLIKLNKLNNCKYGGTEKGIIQSSATKETKQTKEGCLSKTVMEPAIQPDGSPLTPVWWESTDGTLHGPCPVTDVARSDGRFWLVVQNGEQMAWLHESLLRARPEGRRRESSAPQPRCEEPKRTAC